MSQQSNPIVHDADLEQEAKEHVRDLAEKTKRAATDTAKAQVEAAKDTAAGRVENAADAAKAASAEFDPQSMQAEAARQVADRLEMVASRIRHTDLESLARQTSDFARRNPMLFIGGALVAGFAATRFLKARSPQQGTYSDDDPWNDEGHRSVLSRLNEERRHA